MSVFPLGLLFGGVSGVVELEFREPASMSEAMVSKTIHALYCVVVGVCSPVCAPLLTDRSDEL